MRVAVPVLKAVVMILVVTMAAVMSLRRARVGPAGVIGARVSKFMTMMIL